MYDHKGARPTPAITLEHCRLTETVAPVTPHGCTIVAGNYFAHARVVAGTFLDHHPDGRFTVLVLDGRPPAAAGDRFDVLEPDDIFDSREFARMATMYTVIELATAVKPTFLRHLIDDGSPSVLYLDPDIEVFASLADVSQLAAEHGIVLTPHLIQPTSRWDGLVPTEDIVLAAGAYNLGFIGVGAGARGFLDWWIDCLARECIIDVASCRFVDQRWIDLVPGYFGAYVLRDPGLNVAWWNLPARAISNGDDGYRVNGSILRFMHYSGYDPGRPHVLSKHQGPAQRVLLDQRPDLTGLYGRYSKLLVDAGFAELSRRTYGYETLPSGATLDRQMREVYRDALIRWEREGTGLEPPCPFVPGEEAAFAQWIQASIGREARRSRTREYAKRILGERAYSALGRGRRRLTGLRRKSPHATVASLPVGDGSETRNKP